MANLVLLQGSLIENPVTTDATLGVTPPVLEEVRVPEELIVAEDTDGMMLEMFPESGLRAEAIVTEDAEQGRVRLTEQLMVINQNLGSLYLRVLQHVPVVIAQIIPV